MKSMLAFISFALLLITLYFAVKGLDLKTKNGWLFVLSGFFSGFLSGLSLDVNLIDSFGFGIFTGMLIAYTGVSHLRIKRWAKTSMYYKKYMDDE